MANPGDHHRSMEELADILRAVAACLDDLDQRLLNTEQASRPIFARRLQGDYRQRRERLKPLLERLDRAARPWEGAMELLRARPVRGRSCTGMECGV